MATGSEGSVLSPGFRVAVPATLLLHGGVLWALASMPRAPAHAAQAKLVEIELVTSGPLTPSAGGGLGRGQTLRAAALGFSHDRVKGRRRTLRAELALAGGGTAAAGPMLAAPAAPMLAAVGPSTSPQYRNHPPPVYPRASLRRHEQGTALLLVTIGAEGRALAVSIEKSSGYAALDQAALGAVREWTFEPSRAAGRSAVSQALVPVRFAMSDR